ncbi:MAG: L,D-transpeptidase family protein [Anaerolineae bacterium]|nr:L,D-transpeptidase family protein [Anaerolineae bacterium]
MTWALFKEQLDGLSRRDFLKMSAAFLVSIMLPPRTIEAQLTESQNNPPLTIPPYGRVFKSNTPIYQSRSFSAEKIGALPADKIVKIRAALEGEADKSGNPLWYQLDKGTIHSSSVQPVKAQLNPAYREINKSRLAEVTVPYTDAYRQPGLKHTAAYRYYFGSTHWVTDVLIEEKAVWYKVRNERGKGLYVNAVHLHIFQPEELQPISLDVPAESKRIEIHLEKQMLFAYEDDSPVFVAPISSGAKFSSGNFTTPRGRYITNRKRPSRHMSYLTASRSHNYDLPGVPWVSYLTTTGISIHGTYWHNSFGRPLSHGCINLTPEASRWIFLWTQPIVPFEKVFWAEADGTRVEVL